MIQRIAIMDTETTGIEADAVCIEIACIVFDVPSASTVRAFSSLMRAESNPAEAINGIPSALVASAPEATSVWKRVERVVDDAEIFVSHGAEFDQRFIPFSVVGGLPFICSLDDLAWPKQTRQGMNLTALALAHGLGVSHVHRAMADCDMLARLFARVAEMGVDLQAMLARGMRPKARFVVAARGFDAERNALASANGFRFEAATKSWYRTIAIDDVADLPFEVERADAREAA